MPRKVLIDEELLKKLLSGEDIVKGYKIRLGRWVLRKETGETIGSKGKA